MADNTRRPVPAGGAPTPDAAEQAQAAPVQTDAGVEQQNQAAPVQTDAGVEQQNQADQADQPDGDVEARVLVDFDGRAVNDIMVAPAELVESLRLAGRVDPHADAVAYAKSVAA